MVVHVHVARTHPPQFVDLFVFVPGVCVNCPANDCLGPTARVCPGSASCATLLPHPFDRPPGTLKGGERRRRPRRRGWQGRQRGQRGQGYVGVGPSNSVWGVCACGQCVCVQSLSLGAGACGHDCAHFDDHRLRKSGGVGKCCWGVGGGVKPPLPCEWCRRARTSKLPTCPHRRGTRPPR